MPTPALYDTISQKIMYDITVEARYKRRFQQSQRTSFLWSCGDLVGMAKLFRAGREGRFTISLF